MQAPRCAFPEQAENLQNGERQLVKDARKDRERHKSELVAQSNARFVADSAVVREEVDGWTAVGGEGERKENEGRERSDDRVIAR